METEKWIDIDEWVGYYQISNFGNVRSIDREIFNKGNGSICKQKGKLLKPNITKFGYAYVGFFKSGEKKIKSVYIHKLVAKHFCDGYKVGLEVNHIDGIRNNNHYKNLEWVTRSENIRDSYKRNGSRYGELGSNSKLNNKDIGVIASLYDFGVSQHIIAEAFGVSQATISNLIKNKTYKNGLIEKGEAIDVNTLPENPYK